MSNIASGKFEFPFWKSRISFMKVNFFQLQNSISDFEIIDFRSIFISIRTKENITITWILFKFSFIVLIPNKKSTNRPYHRFLCDWGKY